jgi:hypothetical protein
MEHLKETLKSMLSDINDNLSKMTLKQMLDLSGELRRLWNKSYDLNKK